MGTVFGRSLLTQLHSDGESLKLHELDSNSP